MDPGRVAVSGRGLSDTDPVVILVLVHGHSDLLQDVVIMSISRVLLLHPCLMLRPVHMDEDRGDLLCPRYTDCQQLRDETSAGSVHVPVYGIPVVLYTILY